MTRRWRMFTGALAGFVVAGSLALSLPALAQRPTEEQILNALRPPPETVKTRGLTTTETRRSSDDQQFVDSLRNLKTRQLTPRERAKVATIAKTRPSIDLEIYFDYDSAEISSSAEPDLMTLGKALTNPDLRGSVFLIAGHTDAKGGTDYNQRLSERRAAAVKRFLRQKFDLSEESLVTAGYGKEQLKNSSDPDASENRRVQIVNLESKATARR